MTASDAKSSPELAKGRLSRRHFTSLALLAAAAYLAARPAGAAAQRTRLFVIERSKNKNIVCYDLVHAYGQVTPPKLDVYWLMNQKQGERAELTPFERDRAYGYRLVSSDPLKFALKAAPERTIEVVVTMGQPSAKMAISGAQATLDSVYVKTREGGLLPHVLYVEIRGRTVGGNPITERMAR